MTRTFRRALRALGRSRHLTLEPLESRLVLSTLPLVVSEIMYDPPTATNNDFPAETSFRQNNYAT